MKYNAQFKFNDVSVEGVTIGNLDLNVEVQYDLLEMQEMYKFVHELVQVIKVELPEIITNLKRCK